MSEITSFSHIYHPVRDIDETIEFYTKNLGFRLLRRYRNNGNDAAYIELGDVLLELSKADPSRLPTGDYEYRLGLTVKDLDGITADLKRKGIEFVREPSAARTFWGRQAAIKDPNGYAVSLREWEAPDNPRYGGWQPRSAEVERTG